MKVTDFNTRFEQLKKSAPEAIAAIRPGQRVFIGSGCGEPQHLVNALLDRASGFSDLEIVRLLSLESSLIAMMAEESQDRIFNVRSFYQGSGQSRSLKANWRYIAPISLSPVP
nr:acetyl-CoA hydrolase [Desulfobacterales bacterium]